MIHSFSQTIHRLGYSSLKGGHRLDRPKSGQSGRQKRCVRRFIDPIYVLGENDGRVLPIHLPNRKGKSWYFFLKTVFLLDGCTFQTDHATPNLPYPTMGKQISILPRFSSAGVLFPGTLFYRILYGSRGTCTIFTFFYYGRTEPPPMG